MTENVVTVPLKTRSKKLRGKKSKLKVPAEVRRRFESYLDKKQSKCWVWKGSRTADGYGQFWLNDRKVVKAHRFGFELYVRQLGKKERLKNVCKDKYCMNPACWQPATIGQRKVVKSKARKRSA